MTGGGHCSRTGKGTRKADTPHVNTVTQGLCTWPLAGAVRLPHQPQRGQKAPGSDSCGFPVTAGLGPPLLCGAFLQLTALLQLCVIADCGELKEGDDWGLFPQDGSGDSYPDFPEDADVDLKDVSAPGCFVTRYNQALNRMTHMQHVCILSYRWTKFC